MIVAHGSPSDPEPQERFVQELAARVGRAAGIAAHGATLARKGALEAAVAGMSAPLIFPHFMADGWFVSTSLPARLKAAGLADWTTMPPLGLTDGLRQIARERLEREINAAGFGAGKATLVVAAHGSPSDPRPAEATERFAGALGDTGLFGQVRVGYVDEEPSLEEAAKVEGPAIVLPFFAARAGHVLMDLPEALEAARFDGPVLEPIGTWEEIPHLIAERVRMMERAA